MCSVILSVFAILTITLYVTHLNNKNNSPTISAYNENDIYEEKNDDKTNNEQILQELNSNNENNKDKNEPFVENTKTNVKFTYLGEIMMGGVVTENVNYMYNTSFKKIYNLTRYSDYTYTSISTNITSLNEIKEARSKYIVTSDILSAFNSLGIDGVTVATDYITDYSKNIFNNTIKELSDNNFNVSGLNDSTVYFEKNGKKIAIISATNSYLNNKQTYLDYGINVYSKKTMENDIKIAKENADFVIVDVHWGKSNVDTITREMADIAMDSIDNGADLVLGAHSLGAKGVIMYEGKPIVYSAGYLITDSNVEEAKKSYIYNFNINENNEIDEIQMIPMYGEDKKIVQPYYEYDVDKSNEYMKKTISEMIKFELEGNIHNNSIIIKLPQDTTY